MSEAHQRHQKAISISNVYLPVSSVMVSDSW